MIARQERWYWTNPAKPKLHTQLKPHLAHVFAFPTPSHLSLTSTFLIWWDMNNLTAKRVSTWQASAPDSFTRFTRGIKVSGAPKQVSRSVCLFPEIKTLSMGHSARPALTQFFTRNPAGGEERDRCIISWDDPANKSKHTREEKREEINSYSKTDRRDLN